jgi:hypothetical protein
MERHKRKCCTARNVHHKVVLSKGFTPDTPGYAGGLILRERGFEARQPALFPVRRVPDAPAPHPANADAYDTLALMAA